jgi:hypothetical protein
VGRRDEVMRHSSIRCLSVIVGNFQGIIREITGWIKGSKESREGSGWLNGPFLKRN